MRIGLKFFLIIFLINLFSGLIYAEKFKVTIEPEKSKIFLGDKVKFKITVQSDENILKTEDNITKIFTKFSIENLKKNVKEKKAEFLFTLQFFQTGDITLPQAVFTVTTNTGKLTVYSDRLNIKVLTNLKDNSTFQPVKGPIAVKFYLTSKEWILLISVVLAVALLICLLILFLKKRKKYENLAPPVPPFEEFNNCLNKCSALIEQNRIRDFYFYVSEISRRYIDKKFHLSTLEATLKEIEQMFNQSIISSNIKNELLNLFKKWEFYKFTNNFPEKKEALNDFAKIKDLTGSMEKSEDV